MFCKKCGRYFEEDFEVCTNCGAKVGETEIDYSEFNYDSEDFEDEISISQEAPIATESEEDNLSKAKEVVGNFVLKIDKVITEKINFKKLTKNLSKKAKISILAGAALLIIMLIVGISMLSTAAKTVHIKDYLAFSFDEETLYDGRASLSVYFDKDLLMSEKDIDSSYSLDDILSYCNINVSIDNSSKSQDFESDYGLMCVINNLSEDDSITISITWDENLYEVEEDEDRLDIYFDKEDEEIKFQVSEILDEQNLELLDVVEFDFFSTLKDYIEVSGCGEDDIIVSVKDIPKTKIENSEYSFVYDSSSKMINVLDSDGYSVSTSEVESDHTEYTYSTNEYSKGDTIEFYISSEKLSNINLWFKETLFTYTVNGNAPLSLDEATSESAQLKTDLLKAAKLAGSKNISTYNSFYKYMAVVHEAFYITSDYDSSENIIIIFTKNKKGKSISYTPVIFTDVYYKDSEIRYGSCREESTETTYKDARSFMEYDYPQTSYTITKIK